MELSPSSEATNCVATQELSSIFWNPQIYYRVQKSPPLVPIVNQIDPVHTIPSSRSKIYSNIVLVSLSSWLSHQYPICIPLLPTRATCPAHFLLFDLTCYTYLNIGYIHYTYTHISALYICTRVCNSNSNSSY
jgi:hypothetical protein